MLKRLTLIGLVVCLLTAAATAQKQELVRMLSKRPMIDKIVVTGNQSFDEKTIRKNFAAKEDGFWQSVSLMRANRYTKVTYERDLILLQYFYRSKGFDDAEVEITLTPGHKSESAVVHIAISEGQRYRIARLNITGDLGSDGYRIGVAANALREGEYLNRFAVNEARNGIKAIFANKGYPYADVAVDIDKDTAQAAAAININITRNQLVLFGDVIVDTNLLTKPHIFRQEITFKKNDIYSRDKFFESQQRLIRTGLFNFVTLKLPESMSPLDSLQPDFYVSAVERKPRFAAVGGGAAQDEQAGVAVNAIGSFGDRNIRGTARSANLSLTTSFTFKDSLFVRPKYQFVYTEPYLFRIRMPLILTFKYEPRAASPSLKYHYRSFTVDATTVREFSLKTKLSTSLNYEQVDVDSAVLRTALEPEGITINRRLILQLERDSRPIQSRFNPSSGSYTVYRFEYVGGILGGDNDFIKLLYSWSKYNRFGSKTVFASRIRLGYVNEFGTSSDVPAKERFYLGGAYTMRGFPENDFGPHEMVLQIEGADTTSVSVPVGGEAIALVNLELRRPLFGKLWGSYFIDSGFNVDKLRNVTLKQVAVTTGVGLQFMSPVGPVRLDYGQRININRVDSGGQFHVGILYAF